MPSLLAADDEYTCSSIGLPIAWNEKGFITPADIAKDPRIVAVAQIQTGDDPGKDHA